MVPHMVWQQKTLDPPPYAGVLGDMVNGRWQGDDAYDALDTLILKRAVCRDGGDNGVLRILPDRGNPTWPDMDWEAVRRGQKLWTDCFSAVLVVYFGILLMGLSIARFSEVLVASGYAGSKAVTGRRFAMTGMHILDWLRFDLSDPDSGARASLKQARAMHSLARRKASHNCSSQGDVPLSQWDVAEVLLGFSAVSVDGLRALCGCEFTRAEEDDMIAAWRVIGWFLGQDDRFNPCSSHRQANECYKEWLSYSKTRFENPWASCVLLQESATGGFGLYPPGRIFFTSLYKNIVAEAPRLAGVSHVNVSKLYTPGSSLPLVETIIHFAVSWTCVRNGYISRKMFDYTCRERDTHLSKPKSNRFHPQRLAMAEWCDTVMWPAISYTCVAVAVCVCILVVVQLSYLPRDHQAVILLIVTLCMRVSQVGSAHLGED
ncbi:hypothetical protein DIPPA_60011 [Diplonema papillatum]|nr:hypothetical protein DIPPA_60011 [Diplonema papillatum]